MYRYETLDGIGLQQLADCFNLAFSDYEQPIRFSAESLKYYLTASSVDLSLSCGAYCGEALVAFILNSSGIYQKESVVFDAGTGVVPEHRGKRVFSDLFEYTVQQLQQRKITKYYLEVLQSNDRAVSIYRKKGFSARRSYSVLVASGPRDGWDGEIPVMSYQDFAPFATAFSIDPSFEHTTHTMNQNPQLYEVRYLQDQAYCIYAKRNGEIIQMHYNALDALKEVMSSVISRYPSAMAKNVDYDYPEVLQMLKEIGFKEILKQYEMAREI